MYWIVYVKEIFEATTTFTIIQEHKWQRYYHVPLANRDKSIIRRIVSRIKQTGQAYKKEKQTLMVLGFIIRYAPILVDGHKNRCNQLYRSCRQATYKASLLKKKSYFPYVYVLIPLFLYYNNYLAEELNYYKYSIISLLSSNFEDFTIYM